MALFLSYVVCGIFVVEALLRGFDTWHTLTMDNFRLSMNLLYRYGTSIKTN